MTEEDIQAISADAAEGSRFYVVKYAERQWKSYDTEGQEFCFQQWAKKAEPLGCTHVVLQLIPDAMDALFDDVPTKPYVERQYEIPRKDDDTVKVELWAKIDIPKGVYDANPAASIAAAHEAITKRVPLGARWEMGCDGRMIEQGRRR